jgi:hypothetical protein
MDMCPPTDLDYSTYPHVFLTSDSVWDPTSFDDEYTPDGIPDYGMDRVNNFGELLERSSKVQHTSVEYNFNSTLYDNDMDAVIETNLNDNLAHYVDICIHMAQGSNTAAHIPQCDFNPFTNIPYEAHESNTTSIDLSLTSVGLRQKPLSVP